MRWIHSLRRRMRSLVSKDSTNAELSEELQFHLDRAVEQNMSRGMPEREAIAAAQRSFGNWAEAAEGCYRARGTAIIDDFFQDLRYALRGMAKHRSFSVMCVLTLALGIGACTAIFSVFDAVLLRSLPYGNPKQLVYLYTPSPQLLRMGIPAEVFNPSFADFFDLKRQSHSIAEMTQFQETSLNLTAGGHAVRVGAARIDADFFRTLKSQPEVGRAISADDQKTDGDRVVIISHSIWEQMFARANNILESTIVLNGTHYRVIGVMPAGFEYPQKSDLPSGFGGAVRTQVWLPLTLTAQQRNCRDFCGAFALARLRREVTASEAETELSTIMGRLDSLHNPAMHDFTAHLVPLLDIAVGPVRPLMRLLMAAVAIVLLIACANAGNLLIARAAGRAHELGVRATLGARRERLLRQMITESLMLSVIAGCVGIGFAWVFLHALLSLKPGDIPRIDSATVDFRVLGFAAAITIVTGLLFGTLPSWTTARMSPAYFLKGLGKPGVVGDKRRTRKGITIAQVALVVVLLMISGLLLRSYQKVLAVPVGLSPSTITANIQLNPQLTQSPATSRYATPEKRRAFFAAVLDRLQHSPGMQAAGWIDLLPLNNSESMAGIEIEGYPNQKNQLVEARRVSSGYFSAMQIPFVQGQAFGDDEGREGPEQVIVNEALARQYFGKGNPVGKNIRFSPQNSWARIAGVVGDVRNKGPEASALPQVYQSLWRTDTSSAPINSAYLAVRSTLPEAFAVQEIRTAVEQVDPNLAVADVHTIKGLESEVTSRRRFQTVLLSAFALIAMALALVGVYGLLAFSVSQRSGEIGIRMALGSTRNGVLGLMLREGLMLYGTGLAIGIATFIGLARLISRFLYGVPANDPLTLLMIPSLLLVGIIAASLVPALRAARLDPMTALRRE